MVEQVSEQGLSRDELIALRNRRTGVTVFQLSWIMVFVCLVLINWQIRSNFAVWPPQGVARMEPLLPTLVTALLVFSGFTARRALQAINGGDMARFTSQWRLTIGLGVAFIVVMAIQFITVNDAGQYGQISRVMIAYHALHALAIGAYMWNVDGRVRAGRVTSRDTWAVEAGTKLWYFVIVAWILFFVALYVL